jgi:hypothetical protein
MHPYGNEKVRDLEQELTRRATDHRNQLQQAQRRRARQPFLAPVLRPAGWALRRLGERMEGWASAPSPQPLEDRFAQDL